MYQTLIASPKGDANNRIRKKKPCNFVCLYVCPAPKLGRFTTDKRLFGLQNYTKNMRCDQNKNNSIYLISFPLIYEKLLK
jgi:hypothetical protein